MLFAIKCNSISRITGAIMMSALQQLVPTFIEY